ncbi:hypothetical protein E4K10_43800 [Streptomyces sp. T1317-0309]|nr:hypothetical protein E4K10_43800 [Streptomyces sp. T1317-0309]
MISPITYRAQDESDAAFLRRLFAGVLDATLGLEAWPEREREFTLRLQYDARERGWAERHPPGQLDIIEVDGVRAGRIRLSQRGGRGIPPRRRPRRPPEFRRRGLASAALTRHRQRSTSTSRAPICPPNSSTAATDSRCTAVTNSICTSTGHPCVRHHGARLTSSAHLNDRPPHVGDESVRVVPVTRRQPKAAVSPPGVPRLRADLDFGQVISSGRAGPL